MDREFDELKNVVTDTIVGDENYCSVFVDKDGTYEWKIVGQPDPEREEIIRQILECSVLTEDDIGEPVFEFWVDHWNEFEASGPDIDRYAWLNTLFGYDIGAEKAKAIMRFMYNKLDDDPADLVGSEWTKSLMEVINHYEALDLNFDSFATEEPETFRYDF